MPGCGGGSGTSSSGSGTLTDSSLPVDPGEDGNSTLVGVDTDGDGVRDDIQIRIYDRHPDSQLKRQGLLLVAMGLQLAIVSVAEADDSKREEAVSVIQQGIVCFPDQLNIRTELVFLESSLTNTDDRIVAYNEFSNSMSGSILTLPSLDICDR